MADFALVCRACGEPFVAKSPQAVWCSKRCRQRVTRAKAAHQDSTVEVDSVDEALGGLVVAIEADLRAVSPSAVDSVAGQLALTLARKLTAANASAPAALAKEIRLCLDSARTGSALPPPRDNGDDVDELDQIARKREEKLRAAVGEASS